MNPLVSNICAALCAAVRDNAKGTDASDAEIVQGMRQSIPGTVKAACDACARGYWGPKPTAEIPTEVSPTTKASPDKKVPKKK